MEKFWGTLHKRIPTITEFPGVVSRAETVWLIYILLNLLSNNINFYHFTLNLLYHFNSEDGF